MSADNGIYIAKFPEGFRVAHCQGIDNLDDFPTNDRKKMLKFYFGNAPIFETEMEAFSYGWKIAENYSVLEYGVASIGKFESFLDEGDKMNEDYSNIFWIVVGKFPTHVTYKHSTYESAEKEAIRLAHKSPGEEFVVMASLAGFVNNSLMKVKYVSPQDNPKDGEYIPF